MKDQWREKLCRLLTWAAILLSVAIGLLISGCNQLPSGVSESKAKKVYAAIKSAELQTGYSVTKDDEWNGIPGTHQISDPKRREFKRLISTIPDKYSVSSDDVLAIYSHGKEKGW